MAIKNRINVLKYFLMDNKSRVSISEIINFLLQPNTVCKGSQFVASIKRHGNFNEITLKNLPFKLYWDTVMPLKNLYGSIYEVLSKDISNWHYYEIPETKVNENDVVVDCGAAEGLFALSVMDRCKELYVIEPNVHFIALLEKQFSQNNNVIIIPKAVGAQSGHAYINELSTGSNITQLNTGIRVEITTLDELFADKNKKLNYIKGDLEGYELDMLQGARKTIKAYRPKIAITTYHQNQDYMDLINEVLNIVPDYRWKIKGLEPHKGNPVMLHMWC